MNKLNSIFDPPCECNLCEPDMVFECPGCLRDTVPYCQGQDDDYYDYCTPCFWELSNNLVTVVIQHSQPQKPNLKINS
jgi:hypothetical protein